MRGKDYHGCWLHLLCDLFPNGLQDWIGRVIRLILDGWLLYISESSSSRAAQRLSLTPPWLKKYVGGLWVTFCDMLMAVSRGGLGEFDGQYFWKN